MKSIFENKCIYTYEYYLQLKKKTMDKGFVNTGYGIALIMFLLGAFMIYKTWYSLGAIFFIVMAFMLYRVIATPIRLASFTAKKNREIHGKDIETQNNFYDDHLLAINANSGNKTNIKYTDVLGILESKDLYILSMENKFVILIDKNGFTKGAKEDFLEFIKEQCVNAEVQL